MGLQKDEYDTALIIISTHCSRTGTEINLKYSHLYKISKKKMKRKCLKYKSFVLITNNRIDLLVECILISVIRTDKLDQIQN